jgi:hypothetical protein
MLPRLGGHATVTVPGYRPRRSPRARPQPARAEWELIIETLTPTGGYRSGPIGTCAMTENGAARSARSITTQRSLPSQCARITRAACRSSTIGCCAHTVGRTRCSFHLQKSKSICSLAVSRSRVVAEPCAHASVGRSRARAAGGVAVGAVSGDALGQPCGSGGECWVGEELCESRADLPRRGVGGERHPGAERGNELGVVLIAAERQHQ